MRKLAVLVHGQPRFIEYTWDFIKEEYNIPEVETYYFGHLWELVGYIPDDDRNTNYTKHNILPDIQKDFTLLKIDNYQNLDNFIADFHPKIKDILIGKNKPVPLDRICNLRYRYGQSYSREQAHILMKEYEEKNNLKFDVVVIIKTDFLYKNKQCYKDEDKYLKRKAELYSDINGFTMHSTSNLIKNCSLTVKPYTTRDQLLGTAGDWQHEDIYHLKQIKNGILLDKAGRTLNDFDRLTIRLQINDHFMACSRDVSHYFCAQWHSHVLHLLKSIAESNEIPVEEVHNMGVTRVRCPFELYGEILLNNKVSAKRIPKHFKRVVNINNCKDKFFETRRQIIFCEFRDILTEQQAMQKKLIEVFM